ncbi:MAG: hypothetical protein IJ214_03975, partial [Clostridia bacterium]|nr:hypothetical protein [Clostridia bacterium]
LVGGTIRACAALMILRQRKSLASRRANRLKRNTNPFAPVTWMLQRELPGRRKSTAVRKNELAHFSRPDADFRCAFCAQHARLCRADRKRWQASLLLFVSVAFTPTNAALSGSLSGSERERPRSHPFPVKFLFSDVLFSSGFRIKC